MAQHRKGKTQSCLITMPELTSRTPCRDLNPAEEDEFQDYELLCFHTAFQEEMKDEDFARHLNLPTPIATWWRQSHKRPLQAWARRLILGACRSKNPELAAFHTLKAHTARN